jgi:zinc transport system substrate-binding protein
MMNAGQGILVAVVALSLAGTVLFADGYSGTGWDGEGRVRVVASFYPLAQFARDIGGDRVEVRSLIPYNQEVHSWLPSTRDILRAQTADVLVWNGAGLDPWFEDSVLKAIDTEGKVLVDTTEGVELLPGPGGDGHAGEADGHDHGEWDPHTWTDPLTAREQARQVFLGLVEADPAGEPVYSARWASLALRFDALDGLFNSTLASRTSSAFFTIHAAFGYLAHRYGLQELSLIGISGDEQPSIDGIAGAVEEMEAQGIYTILVSPQYPEDYSRTLRQELDSRTGHDVVVAKLYQMLGPVDGKGYFEQQGANVATLAAALGAGAA